MAQDCKILNFSAVVLSVHPRRFQTTENILSKIFVSVVKETPILYKSLALQSAFKSLSMFNGTTLSSTVDKKVFSNYVTFRKVIHEFANEPPSISNDLDWRFFFEDDVALHLGANYPACNIRKGIDLARTDGIIYLGICGPTCYTWSSEYHEGILYQRCYGTCAHAFGLTKWKATRILETLLWLQNDLCFDYRIVMDRGLYEYGRLIQPVLVVGSNLDNSQYMKEKSKPHPGHCGLFFQDRENNPSTVWRDGPP